MACEPPAATRVPPIQRVAQREEGAHFRDDDQRFRLLMRAMYIQTRSLAVATRASIRWTQRNRKTVKTWTRSVLKEP